MTLKLVSFDLCPFVQRAVIALIEKGVDHQIEYIDLNDKPDWFLDISPLGKVPVLLVDDTAIFESRIILEYLDEVEEPALHPSEPLAKAHDRAWAEVADQLGGPGYRFMTATDEATVREQVHTARGLLARLERACDEEGPYFRGSELRLVDVVAASMLQRLWWADQLGSLGVFAGFPRCRRWTEALLERDSVKRSLVPDIHDRWLAYLQGKGSPTRDAEPAWLAQMI